MIYHLLVSFSLIILSLQDLPVSCKLNDIIGTWIFEITKPYPDEQSFFEKRCGHQLIDHESHSYLAMAGNGEFVPATKMIIDLQSCYKAILIDDNNYKLGEGKWTPIYDQSAEIIFKDFKFIFHFYYNKDQNQQWKSFCYKTIPGWFYKGKSISCMRGLKVKGTKNENLMYEKQAITELNKGQYSRFKQQSKIKLGLQKNSKDFDSYVAQLNNIVGENRFRNYDIFKNMTFEQLNLFSGRTKGKNPQLQYQSSINDIAKKHKFRFKNSHTNIFFNRRNKKDSFPEYFSLLECLPEAQSQGGCGSCYAISSIVSLQGRLNYLQKKCKAILNNLQRPDEAIIKRNNEEIISLDYALNCNYLNQQCDGGYPYIVYFFGEQVPYIRQNQLNGKTQFTEKVCQETSQKGNINVKKHYYVGGAYNTATVNAIKKDIMEYGPIVLSFEPGPNFMFNGNDVYQEPEKLEANGQWIKVDHSVTCFGWGRTDKNQEYWLLQNSWGPSWGEKGTFKMIMHYNYQGIESMPDAFIADEKQ